MEVRAVARLARIPIPNRQTVPFVAVVVQFCVMFDSMDAAFSGDARLNVSAQFGTVGLMIN